MSRYKLLPALVKTVKKWQRNNKRYSWLYCPACKHDLNGDNESYQFQRLTNVNGQDECFWFYKCANCSCESQWLLDVFPMPVIYARQHFGKKLIKEQL